MKVFFISLAILFMAALGAAQTVDGGRSLDTLPPPAARDLVKRGTEFASQDRVEEAIAAIRKAIAIAPNYLEAHRQYLRLKIQFQGKVDEARSEYESLMAREPANPVYPVAMSQTLLGRVATFPLLKKAAELAPEWSWGHYAKSFVILGRDFDVMNDKYEGRGDQMMAEVLKAIEQNGSVEIFYLRAIHIRERLNQVDEAIPIAEKMAAETSLQAKGLTELWRLRLAKAKGSDAAKENLRSELAKLAAESKEVLLLAAIRNAYATLLKDPAAADAVERKIRKVDSGWYAERGEANFEVQLNSTGIPFPVLAANRQLSIYTKLREIVVRREADNRKQMREIENLLLLHPNPGLKRLIYGILFGVARRAEDIQSMKTYGAALLLLDRTNTSPLSRIALTMAARKVSLPTALRYARRAEAAMAEFRPMSRPLDIPAIDFESRFSVANQQENFKRQQALALDAVGYVLFQMGDHQQAKVKLSRSVEVNKTESSLAHLAAVLEKLGRTDEAQKIGRELDASVLETVKRQFVNRPSKDFQLEAIDGRKYRLSDLKGKVVLINFWATWCAPCVGEMPALAKTYVKYKDRGFEIMAVSTDDANERDKVREFARAHALPFPVLFDDGVARLYDIDSYPGNVFIGRDGNIKYSQGTFEGDRRLEIILDELLK
ncbi:MAG: peroxiredoxin family protein [Pyrinomonadaceae bacterium]